MVPSTGALRGPQSTATAQEERKPQHRNWWELDMDKNGMGWMKDG